MKEFDTEFDEKNAEKNFEWSEKESKKDEGDDSSLKIEGKGFNGGSFHDHFSF